VLRRQVAVLFDRWAALVEESPGDKVHAGYVQHLQQAGFLKARRTQEASWPLRLVTHNELASGLIGAVFV
jgi:hypothetical protein